MHSKNNQKTPIRLINIKLKLEKLEISETNLRHDTTSECSQNSNSNPGTTVSQQPTTQVTFGDDDSSCDSHTKWGKDGRMIYIHTFVGVEIQI